MGTWEREKQLGASVHKEVARAGDGVCRGVVSFMSDDHSMQERMMMALVCGQFVHCMPAWSKLLELVTLHRLGPSWLAA